MKVDILTYYLFLHFATTSYIQSTFLSNIHHAVRVHSESDITSPYSWTLVLIKEREKTESFRAAGKTRYRYNNRSIALKLPMELQTQKMHFGPEFLNAHHVLFLIYP